jgi:hypothetical protein
VLDFNLCDYSEAGQPSGDGSCDQNRPIRMRSRSEPVSVAALNGLRT